MQIFSFPFFYDLVKKNSFSFVFFVISFVPIKIYTHKAPQNVKDEHIIGKQMA